MILDLSPLSYFDLQAEFICFEEKFQNIPWAYLKTVVQEIANTKFN